MGALGRRLVVALAVSFALGCSDEPDAQEAFCEDAREATSLSSVFEDFDPDDVPSATEAFRNARDAEIELRRDAPEAVRADIDLLVQFLDDLVEGLERADPESGQRPAVYEEMRTEFDRVEAASERIEDYVSANCVADTTRPG